MPHDTSLIATIAVGLAFAFMDGFAYIVSGRVPGANRAGDRTISKAEWRGDPYFVMKLTIRSLTPDLWPALEDLFGKNGACNGCWCMYWRIGSGYHKRPRGKNKAAFRAIVKRGPPPGLLAFDGDVAVGWCQLTPRHALRWLERPRLLQCVDEAAVWSLSCFYVRRGYRKRGVMSALIAAAVRAVKRAKAPALEAYPVDTAVPKCTSNRFTGIASAFARAGFKEVASLGPSRPIMRRQLKATAQASRLRKSNKQKPATPPRPAPDR
jgi:GNAT superfamily N-acetyltransferase